MKRQSLFLMLLKFLNEFCQKIFLKILWVPCYKQTLFWSPCGRGRPKSLSQSILVKHRVIVGNSQTNGSQNASRQRQKAFCDGIYIERCSYVRRTRDLSSCCSHHSVAGEQLNDLLSPMKGMRILGPKCIVFNHWVLYKDRCLLFKTQDWLNSNLVNGWSSKVKLKKSAQARQQSRQAVVSYYFEGELWQNNIFICIEMPK